MRDILPSLVAKQIRIIPIVTGIKPKHICMRLELYGCSYQGKKEKQDYSFLYFAVIRWSYFLLNPAR